MAAKPARSALGRVLFVIATVIVGAVGLGVGVFVGLPSMVERAATKAVHRLEARFGVTIEAGQVSWTWGGAITVDDLRVSASGRPLMRAPRMSIDLEVRPLERHVKVLAVHLDRPTFELTRDATGRTNLDTLLAGLHTTGAGGSGSGITIDPTPPAIAMEHAAVEVAAALPPIPFGLALPERMTFRDGMVTIVPEPVVVDGDVRLKLDARFADTTQDPGYGMDVGAVASKSLGLERAEVRFARPLRFFLGQRVVGLGGLAWSPETTAQGGGEGAFELESLQLSVPLARTGASDVVAAALTCDRVTVKPEPLALLRRVARDGGPAAPSLARVLRAIDAIAIDRPVLALSIDDKGQHSFEDLLPRRDLPEGPGLRALPASEPTLSRVASEASRAASDRLLAASGAGGESLAARMAHKVDRLARLSQRVIPEVARALDRLFMKAMSIDDGEVILDIAGTPLELTKVQVKATVDGGDKKVAAAFDIAEAGRVTLGGALLGADQSVVLDVQAAQLPIAWVGGALLRSLHLGEEGTLSHVDLHLTAPVTGARWDVTGEVAVDDLVFQHPSLAHDALRDLDLGWKGRLSFDAALGTLSMPEARVRSKQVGANLDVDLSSGLTVPRVHVGLELPPTALQDLIGAIPAGMMPLLDGLRVDGTLAWSLSVDLDSARPSEVQIKSEPTLSGFGLITMGTKVDFNALRGTHSYRIRLSDGTPGERLVGPYTGSWVPLASITHYLPAALTTTEDGTFYTNDGVSTFAMRESIATNIERGSFVRGGSTITQQLVKNLYLGGEKTISRKLQELFIAWQMTKALSKDEVMALYLNTIEFGPGIYGVGDAAWYYFGKRPSDLDLTEAIFLASIVPGPRRYHYFFEEGRITERWRGYLQSLLKIMVDRGKILDEELLAAAPYDPRFRGSVRPVDDDAPDGFDAPPQDIEELNGRGDE